MLDLRTTNGSINASPSGAAVADCQTTNGRIDFRIEAFNVLNRANFGVPELRAFAGQADNETPLATFGRISNTVTSSRQIQLGVRASF